MPIPEDLLKRIEKNDPHIKEIILSNVYPLLTAEDMEELVKAIQKNNNPHIKTLIFPGNAIGDKGAIALSHITTLEELIVDGNDITDEGAKALVKLPHLKILQIAGNDIGDEGLKVFLQHPTLEKLTIHDNNITNEGAKLALQNQKLITLLIEDFGDHGIKIDAKILKEIKEHIKKNQERKISSLSKNSFLSEKHNKKRKREEISKETSEEDIVVSKSI